MTVRDITEDVPPVDELPHKEDLPPYNGGRKAEWATDDEGNIYRVTTGDRVPLTLFTPLEQTREYALPRREAVGDPCSTCGEEIGPFAIILVDNEDETHHLGCWASENE